MQEKQGVVRPGVTPDIDQKLPKEKRAAQPDRDKQTRELDDDFTHRAADLVASK